MVLALLKNRWIQLALVGLVALFFLWRWVAAKEEIGALKTVVEVQKGEIEEAVAANGTNQTTITDLQTRLNALVLQRQTEAEERERSMAERERELAAARAETAAERRRNRELFRSTAGCEELAGLRIDLACPAVAERLRNRASQSGD